MNTQSGHFQFSWTEQTVENVKAAKFIHEGNRHEISEMKQGNAFPVENRTEVRSRANQRYKKTDKLERKEKLNRGKIEG
jgi:hypothetical protein